MKYVMAKTVFKFTGNYLLFFWSITWRTFALSMATALLTGFGLAIVTVTNNLPEDFISLFAPMVGVPITLLVGLYVVSERILKTRQTAVQQDSNRANLPHRFQ